MEQKNGILSGALIICRAKNGILQGHKVCMGLRDHILYVRVRVRLRMGFCRGTRFAWVLGIIYVSKNGILQGHKVCLGVRDHICI